MKKVTLLGTDHDRTGNYAGLYFENGVAIVDDGTFRFRHSIRRLKVLRRDQVKVEDFVETTPTPDEEFDAAVDAAMKELPEPNEGFQWGVALSDFEPSEDDGHIEVNGIVFVQIESALVEGGEEQEKEDGADEPDSEQPQGNVDGADGDTGSEPQRDEESNKNGAEDSRRSKKKRRRRNSNARGKNSTN